MPLKTIASKGGSETSFDIYGIGMKKQESIAESSLKQWNNLQDT